MGYLQSTNMTDFSKAVISLWFRVPQASLDAANTEAGEDFTLDSNPLTGIVPFIMFGNADQITEHWTFNISGLGQPTNFVDVGSAQLGPSYIGIQCDGNGNYALGARIQYSTSATFGNLIDPRTLNVVGPDFFEVGPYGNNDIIGGGSRTPIPITADVWHHLLVSFDLSQECFATGAYGQPISVSSNCSWWWALDDVNYSGDTLWPSGPYNGSNGIITGYGLFSGTNNPHLIDNIGPYSFPPVAIPASNTPFGIPGVAKYSDKIRSIEMAEFQLFTGVTLDTSSEVNRRAFINASGGPVLGLVTQSGTVISPRPPIKLLGKTPDIAFTTANANWIKALNEGSLKHSAFQKTGTIRSFVPGPKLGR